MDTLEDSEKNVKVSDSAYSNSCSNSQSRRSHSSKSTHSGSNSSGSSGYGGKPSGSSYNSGQQARYKNPKKKSTIVEAEKITEVKTETESTPPEPAPEYENLKEELSKPVEELSPVLAQVENAAENMDVSAVEQNSCNEEVSSCNTTSVNVSGSLDTTQPPLTCDEFSCVVSMDDGVLMYTTPSLTSSLGFPKDMWLGRSFVDFVHPMDRDTFTSHITNGFAIPKIVNGTHKKAQFNGHSDSTMVCRLRRYRGLTSGFGVKERVVTYMPFLLKFMFKNISDEEGSAIYLVIQAQPFFSAFKTPNEVVSKGVPFVMKHSATGNLEYIDPESVPYIGYLPQEIINKDALRLYHPDDLNYLCQVYEMIVKEGGVSRSKPYRIMVQNGDSIKVETQWSSFVNPWSRKLEFIIGKHYVVEGPANPDVFQAPDPEKTLVLSEEDKKKANILRESITRIMSEVLSKPAGLAKRQMSKRCRELATFMESLMEEQPKPDSEFQQETQDTDHSCFERDSVMLGGISPHHDYNDSKSSTETPLSYNQLNYNETIQRFFSSHQSNFYEEYNTVTREDVAESLDPKPSTSKGVSPVFRNCDDSGEMSSSCKSGCITEGGHNPVAAMTDYQDLRLTEALLIKHNAEMEKRLVKVNRGTKLGTKVVREKLLTENRNEKKEPVTKCHPSPYQPLPASMRQPQCHGVKRTLKLESEGVAMKHLCTSPHASRRKSTATNTAPFPRTTTTAASNWTTSAVNSVNSFILGVGIPQQVPLISPVQVIPGVFPLYYAAAATTVPSVSNTSTTNTTATAKPQMSATPMQCMVYGQPLYGPTFMNSSVVQPIAPAFQTMRNHLNPLGLPTNTHEERKGVVPGNDPQRPPKAGDKVDNSEETVDRTDVESSYSSFYSSFLKTESGSAEESVDMKNKAKYPTPWDRTASSDEGFRSYQVNNSGETCNGLQHTVTKKKMEPPWMEKIQSTSDLIYKYQILTKSMEEVLSEDMKKIMELQQPNLVNEQLGQLYVDLQLEGVAAKLTLEEGITSSSSSGEETTSKVNSHLRKKRTYSKLVMIYEEDAPLPPPNCEFLAPSAPVSRSSK